MTDPQSPAQAPQEADDLVERAQALWNAIQSETRGIGLDRAGNFCSPPSHENFERFIYKHFADLLAAITRLRASAALAKELAEALANVIECECETRGAGASLLYVKAEHLNDARAALSAFRAQGEASSQGENL